MIKVNELRIGNYVVMHGVLHVVDLDLLTVIVHNNINIEGFPLTPKLLEKAGLIKDEWSYIFPFNGGNTAYSIEQYGNQLGLSYSGELTKETWIEYLHQLQNLYFALTKEELQINF